MKKLTRERVVPIISASTSACECYGVIQHYDGELGLKYRK